MKFTKQNRMAIVSVCTRTSLIFNSDDQAIASQCSSQKVCNPRQSPALNPIRRTVWANKDPPTNETTTFKNTGA